MLGCVAQVKEYVPPGPEAADAPLPLHVCALANPARDTAVQLVRECQTYSSCVAVVQVKEYVPPAPEAADAPPTSLSLVQLKADGEAKQAALEGWCKTAYGEVSLPRGGGVLRTDWGEGGAGSSLSA